MDIKTSKIELVKLILNIDNSEFLKKVTEFISNEQADFWNHLTPTQQAEIKKGIEQLDRGERISFKDALKGVS